MTNTIKTLLQLKDKNITIIDACEEHFINKQKIFILKGTLTYDISCCPVCRQKKIVKNGTRLSKIKLLKLLGINTYLHLRKQCFVCQSCHHCCTAETTLVDKHCCIAKVVKQAILLATKTVKSRQMIADEHDVSASTVQLIIEQASTYFKQKYYGN